MELKEFLEQENIGINEFARRSGVNSSTISKLLSKQIGIRLVTAEKIVKSTGGLVGYEDLKSAPGGSDADLE